MRAACLPAGIALALAPAFAGAQEAPVASRNATTLDSIEVTGSRIRQVDLETAAPVLQLTREDIEGQGFSSVADILQNITAAGSPAISRTSPLSSGEAVGGQYIDLRNLGANRTLILVNGKRLGITNDGLQDVAPDPGLDGRAHRNPEGRRLHHLRFGRHRRRGQHHHPQELRRRRSQCLLSASTTRATAPARSTTS